MAIYGSLSILVCGYGFVGGAIAGQARFAKPLWKAKLHHCSAKIVSQITAMTHVAE
jgi:hypothetical protein